LLELLDLRRIAVLLFARESEKKAVVFNDPAPTEYASRVQLEVLILIAHRTPVENAWIGRGDSLLNVPSSGIVCRGPASNIHVTLSERPFGWQTMQPPHDSLDIRLCGPRPV
jgi:hypothetical protein